MTIIGFFLSRAKKEGKAGIEVYLGRAVTQDFKSEPNNPLGLHFLDVFKPKPHRAKITQANSMNTFYFSPTFLDRNKNHTTSMFRLMKRVVYTEQSDD